MKLYVLLQLDDNLNFILHFFKNATSPSINKEVALSLVVGEF